MPKGKMMKFKFIALAAVTGLAYISTAHASESPLADDKVSTQISPAPGKGIIQGVNNHIPTLPFLFNLDRQPKEQMGDLLTRQYFHGSESTFVKRVAKKGAKVPLHKHPNEQITWLMSGEAKVYSGGKEYVMKAGDMMVFPANVPHEFHFTEDTIDVDFFAPARQDWIDGTADYIKK